MKYYCHDCAQNVGYKWHIPNHNYCFGQCSQCLMISAVMPLSEMYSPDAQKSLKLIQEKLKEL